MPELLGSLEHGPFEEIRISVVQQRGQSYLELRVYRKPLGGAGPAAPTAEGLLLPIHLLDKLLRVLETTGGRLRGRPPVQPPAGPPIVQMVGGDPAVMAEPKAQPQPAAPPRPQFVGARTHGRADRRIPLDCPVEYAVRGRQGQGVERRRGRAKDINRNGAQVVLPERVPVLTPMVLVLRLPQYSLRLPCEVVWAQLSRGADLERQGCCHGVRFTSVGPAEAQFLERLASGEGAAANSSLPRGGPSQGRQ
jgi:hypothetical protein